MTNNLSPVVLFVYNRPWHTLKTLEALKANFLSEESQLFVFSDGPKSNATGEQIANIHKVRELVRSQQWCKSVEIIESEVNKGLARSVIDGVTQIVTKFGKVIVLEDDMVTSQHFLTYMNDALSVYEDEEKVICVAGYLYPIKGKVQKPFFLRGVDCAAWATWDRGWKYFEEDGKKLLSIIEHKNLQKEFDYNGRFPNVEMLQEQIEGKTSSWFIRWHTSAFINDKYTLYPIKSMTNNIGGDGSGTNDTDNHTFKTDIANKPIQVVRMKVVENVKMKNRIADFFDPPVSIDKRIKRFIKKIIRTMVHSV